MIRDYENKWQGKIEALEEEYYRLFNEFAPLELELWHGVERMEHARQLKERLEWMERKLERTRASLIRYRRRVGAVALLKYWPGERIAPCDTAYLIEQGWTPMIQCMETGRIEKIADPEADLLCWQDLTRDERRQLRRRLQRNERNA